MTPQQLKDKLYVSVKRGDTAEVRVGIRLEAILTLDSDKEEDIAAATEQGRNDIVEGVYGGRREELRGLINDLFRYSGPLEEDDVNCFIQARHNLTQFQKTL